MPGAAVKPGVAGQDDILNMDIEQLAHVDVKVPAMEVEVTSVSRTSQPIGRSAAAVYVVTNEMIKRSGARNVPEVLRTVPGVHVARVNASAWAISIRGFNARFANKLLVQIDGVAIYSPTHSGVFWEREYVMLEDVERIEVIRGPGATVWGANAVNGIINIVTKSAKDTKGVYAGGGGGNEHRQFGDFRVGGQAGQLHWRMYGMNMEDAKGNVALPQVAADDPRLDQGGFRCDWTPNRCDTVTVQGDFYSGEDNQSGSYTPPLYAIPMDYKTSRILTRWSRQIDEDTDWAVQVYYYNPYAVGANYNNVAMFDTDFQYHFKRGRHDVVWGVGYRNSDERWVMGQGILTVPDDEQIPSYFVQDTITVAEDRLFATFGSKFDHNSVTDFEYQPTARLTWTPTERTSLWGAISRAVRTPSLIERIFVVPRSENVMAYELGVRQQPGDRLFWELATFFNRYESLLATPIFTFNYENVGKADSYGFECNATYQMSPNWRLTGSYTFFIQDVEIPAAYFPSFDIGAAPRNMCYFQSGWDLGKDVTLDVMLRYIDALAAGIPSYVAGDIRLAWRPRTNLELAVVGQNLLAGSHYEFISSYGGYPTEIEPGVYGMISWRY